MPACPRVHTLPSSLSPPFSRCTFPHLPGFFDESNPLASANPPDVLNWGHHTGQDFNANHQLPGIDYAVMHLW